eukprot:363475-Chlamydomonas_euryale.AAC.7
MPTPCAGSSASCVAASEKRPGSSASGSLVSRRPPQRTCRLVEAVRVWGAEAVRVWGAEAVRVWGAEAVRGGGGRCMLGGAEWVDGVGWRGGGRRGVERLLARLGRCQMAGGRKQNAESVCVWVCVCVCGHVLTCYGFPWESGGRIPTATPVAAKSTSATRNRAFLELSNRIATLGIRCAYPRPVEAWLRPKLSFTAEASKPLRMLPSHL